MLEIHPYNDQTPIVLSDEQNAQTQKCIDNIFHSLSFFKVRLNDRPNKTDVHTHMQLLESYYKELASLVSYDSVLTDELNMRNAALREANSKIEQLTAQLGSELSPQAVTGALRHYDKIISLFYGAIGLHYASLQKFTQVGIIYEFDSDMDLEPTTGYTSDKELSKQFQSKLPFLTTETSGLDIHFDTYHASLLDTDNNRKHMIDLFRQYFPDIVFTEFHSRKNDYDSFSLRFTVHIPYVNIENLYQAMTTK